MSEATPLLSDATNGPLRAEDVYDRFSRAYKRAILIGVSLTATITPIASVSLVPCIPIAAKDLNTTGAIINYTIGAYVFTIAIGSLVWAPYTRFYGRKPMYLLSLPMICLGSLGTSISADILQFSIFRTLQACGSSCLMPAGAATISDIYRLEERGASMGVFLGAFLLGPALGSLVGGIFAAYISWRWMQFALFVMAIVALVSCAVFLPETSHPGTRGLDNLQIDEPEEDSGRAPRVNRKWKWVWINPFKPVVELLRGPTICLVAVASSFIVMTVFVLVAPLSFTLPSGFGITNPALIGLFMLPSGVGNMVGATLGGRLGDRAVVKGLKRRGGTWVPEDRLTATLPGALLLAPLSVLAFGLAVQFVSGPIGLAICLVCLFINAIGVDIVISPATTYCVDILRNRSAEIVAVNSALRNALGALAAASVLPMIDKFGVGATNGIAAIVAWLGLGLLWVTIRYGDRLRAWKDIGYTS